MSIEKETILITGACGFVGKFLVKQMKEKGYERLILNCRGDIREETALGYPVTKMELTDPTSVAALFEQVEPDHIIHLAALTRIADGEANPDLAFKTNYLGTKVLLDNALKKGIKTFVFASSDLARNYRSVVGITKFLSEAYLQEINSKDTRISVVRLPNVSWTPGSVHLIFERLINEDRPITVTHPEMSRRFIGGTFAANIILHALESGTHKGTLVVTSPPVRITDLAQSMIAEAGKDLPIEIIGVRPGEKLVEEGYDADEVSHTDMFGLALLKEEANWEKDIGRAFDMLRSKPGCTIKSL